MSLVGEAPEVLVLQTSNLSEVRFWFADLKFVVMMKVSLGATGQTDDDDAVELGRTDEHGGNEVCR